MLNVFCLCVSLLQSTVSASETMHYSLSPQCSHDAWHMVRTQKWWMSKWKMKWKRNTLTGYIVVELRKEGPYLSHPPILLAILKIYPESSHYSTHTLLSLCHFLTCSCNSHPITCTDSQPFPLQSILTAAAGVILIRLKSDHVTFNTNLPMAFISHRLKIIVLTMACKDWLNLAHC